MLSRRGFIQTLVAGLVAGPFVSDLALATPQASVRPSHLFLIIDQNGIAAKIRRWDLPYRRSPTLPACVLFWSNGIKNVSTNTIIKWRDESVLEKMRTISVDLVPEAKPILSQNTQYQFVIGYRASNGFAIGRPDRSLTCYL